MEPINISQKIDVKKVFNNKNPKLAKVLPGFIFKIIQRVIHQDELNVFLLEYGHLTGLDFTEASMKYFNVEVVIHNFQQLPEGKFIFTSNHPLGGFDGIMLFNIISRRYAPVKLLVNDILMNIVNLKDSFVPINKHGSHSKDYAVKINEAFQSDAQIITFPFGLVSRKHKGKIQDLKWKKNFITKAQQYKRDIIPVFVDGRNSNFFYNLAILRKFIGIKSNIEMFFLVNELFKHRGKTFNIIFGKPINYKVFDNRFSLDEWAEKLRLHVYQLEKNHHAGFDYE